MKFVKFKLNHKEKFGIAKDSYIYEIKGSIFGEFKIGLRRFKLKDVNILPPIDPSKVICVGLNYVDHAKELKMDIPKNPIIFLKPPTSVIGDKGFIVYPDSVQRLDYEAELAIVIKKKCKAVNRKLAKDVILGFTCLNDVTARDIQQKDIQWTRSKSFDTFCPIGPFIVDGVDPCNLRIKLLLNGRIKQDSNTQDLKFKPYELVSFISHIMTLMPGDVIATGTPYGIGPMKRGDEVSVEIDKIGRLTNYVV